MGRWSQRKLAVQGGKNLPDPSLEPAAKRDPELNPEPARRSDRELPAPPSGSAEDLASPTPRLAAESTALSLQDVQRLTAESDYAPFVAQNVTPEVRNAAMKKLFADPHYNLMDGLDTYIDDYSKPDPLPATMLRKMASAQFLKLFDDEDEVSTAAGAPVIRTEQALGDDANTAGPDSVARSLKASDTGIASLTDPPTQEPGRDHDHTDL